MREIANKGEYTTIISEFTPLGQWNSKYKVEFLAMGTMDNDYRGTHGTCSKVYDTLEKARLASKRYLNRF